MATYWTVLTKLSSGDSWVQLAVHNKPQEPLEFASEAEVQQWLDFNYPARKRHDVFHGLQPLIVAQIIRRKP